MPEQPFIHSAGDLIVRPGLTLGPRTITDCELVYFPEGSFTVYETDEASYTLDKPGFIFTRPNEVHTYRFDPNQNVRHSFIHFDHAWLLLSDNLLENLMQTDWLPIGQDLLASGMMKRMQLIANLQTPRWKERLSAMLSSVLEELNDLASHSAPLDSMRLPLPVARAISVMDQCLHTPLSIEDIAAESGWSHAHFTRIFTASVGMSPKRALLERRLRRAELLMIEGKLAIKEIAFEVGFTDAQHFSRTYSRIRGYTATRYIEKCQDALFRETITEVDPLTPYPINRYILINQEKTA